MDKRFKEIIKKANSVTLSKAERSVGRERLLAFMRGSEAATVLTSKNWAARFLTPAMVSLVAVFIAGGGVSLASENSLPGDLLYPVKVYVNEEVRAAFSASAESKAGWEARRAERRLEEAERLAVQGKLDEPTEASVEAAFQKHAKRANENLVKVEAKAKFKAASDISSRLETSFKAHGKILRGLKSAAAVAAKADFEADAASSTRAGIEAKILTQPGGPDEEEAAEGKMKAAQNKIAEVKTLISRLDAAATLEAEERLRIAQTVLIQGQAEFQNGNYGQAFVMFQNALRVAEEASLLINAKLDFQIELKLSQIHEIILP